MQQSSQLDTPQLLLSRLWAESGRWLLPCLLLLAAFLRLYMLEQNSLWIDELDQAISGKGELGFTITSPTPPPIDYLITHIMIHYVGQSEGILRLPSVIWGVLCVLVIFYLGKHLFGKPVGYLSAALLAIMPLHIQYSQEVRFYMLPTLLILVSVYALLLALDKKTPGAWFLYGTALLLGLFTHVYVAPVAVFLSIWLILFKRPGRSALLGFAISTGIALILFMGWFLTVRSTYLPRSTYNSPTMSEVLTAPFFDVTLGSAVLPVQPSIDLVRQKLFDYLNVIRWVVGVYWLLLLGAVYVVIRRRAPQIFITNLWLPLVLFFGGLVSAFAVDYLTSYFFAARQFLFYTPMAVLAISATFLYVVQQVGGKLIRNVSRSQVTLGAAVFLVVLSLLILWEPLSDLYKPSKQDWRGLDRYLLMHVGAHDALLTPFANYIGFYAPEVLAAQPNPFPENREAMLELAQTHDRLWIMLVDSSLYERPPVLSEWIDEKHLTPLMFGHDLQLYTYSRVQEF